MPNTLPKTPQAGVPAPKRRRRGNFPQAMDNLQEFCAALRPGDLVPTHTELMRRFDVSERAVLKALDELQRSGKIVRQRGRGTFVTDRNNITELNHTVIPSSLVDTKTIVAILRPDHSFYDRCLELLFRHAKSEDLTVACRLIEERSEWSPQHLAESPTTAGFLIFGWHLEPIARQLQEIGHRVVLMATPPLDETAVVPTVAADQEQGGFIIVRHLLELGHKRLLFPGLSNLSDGVRGRGYGRAIKSWNSRLEAQAARGGSTQDMKLVQPAFISAAQMYSWENDSTAAREFFAHPDASTAVVAWNDHEALRCLRSLQRAGISVPEQVSLTGFDALPEGAMVHPSLTTIDTQTEQQVQSALAILTRSSPPPASHSVIVVPSLLVRESTAHF